MNLYDQSKNSPVVVKDTNLQVSVTDNTPMTPMTPIAAHQMRANFAIQPSSSPYKRKTNHQVSVRRQFKHGKPFDGAKIRPVELRPAQ